MPMPMPIIIECALIAVDSCATAIVWLATAAAPKHIAYHTAIYTYLTAVSVAMYCCVFVLTIGSATTTRICLTYITPISGIPASAPVVAARGTHQITITWAAWATSTMG